jgi:NAD(P)-dependent dehydrogenase (short-subunit alcohol dehydrogenase family)
MRGELEGKVAVVLGGGSIGPGWGIGKAIAVAYAGAGATVAVADRERQSAEETLGIITKEGGRGEAHEVDVTDDEQLSALLSGIVAQHGRIDILHCNVGLGKAGPSENTSPAEWRKFADANLTSLHVAASAVVPPMRANGGGVILVTSSIAGIRHVGYPHLAYGATKAAAIHFMKLLAVENAAYGIRCNTIVAGLIDTPRIEKTLARSYGDRKMEDIKAFRASQCPLGRMGTAFDVANAALFLASDKASYVTGTELVVDGGLSATVQQAQAL